MENTETPKDETELITANTYLAEKLDQSRKDMEAGKGTNISIDELWK